MNQVSKPRVFEKPIGVKDYLPDAVARLRQIERNVLACMQQWGYQEIMTPTLEFYDTVGAASSTSDSKLFKLLDKRGTTMVLRSDVTAPIARVVSSLLKEQPLPLRLSYHSNVFRALDEEASKETEFFQTGIELVGEQSSDADAEIVALAIESLRAAGVQAFKMAIGHVGFLNGLFEETLPDLPDVQMQLKALLLARDYVGFREAVGKLQLTEEARTELEGILRLRGGKEVLVQARELSGDAAAKAAIDHLNEVIQVLDEYGLASEVMIDLTMIGDFSYYTGMIFEGYAANMGFPVCSGGRYDNLLGQFGRPAPATGFALKTNRILESVAGEALAQPERVVLTYTAETRKAVLQQAQHLRATSDVIVETRRG
jgi:ATP phosphoribosyltransferase regulatory subunit